MSSFLDQVTSMNTCVRVVEIKESRIKKTYDGALVSKKNPNGVGKIMYCFDHLAAKQKTKNDGFTVDDARELALIVSSVLPSERVLIVLAYGGYSESAQNALLKTLEETPSHVSVSVIYTLDTRLLPTLLSRTRDMTEASPFFEEAIFDTYRQKMTPEQIIRLQKVLAKSDKLPNSWISDLKKAYDLQK